MTNLGKIIARTTIGMALTFTAGAVYGNIRGYNKGFQKGEARGQAYYNLADTMMRANQKEVDKLNSKVAEMNKAVDKLYREKKAFEEYKENWNPYE